MSTARFAVFVDLENAGGKAETLNNILEKVKIRGDILMGKVYGYTEKFGGLKELLLSNTFTVVPSLRYGVAQKNNADILLVLDAIEVAYTNNLIDSFCIVSGDSDYTPLVGKLKSMGKFVLGISRSEVASTIFINACNEFQFLESVAIRRLPQKIKKTDNGGGDEVELLKQIESILDDHKEDEVFASELKGILLRLRPDFNERNYGSSTFFKLLTKLSQQYGVIKVRSDNYNVMVSLASEETAAEGGKPANQLTKENWIEVFREQLKHYKDDGFDRINPSILKADIQSLYPDFQEKNVGFKRFSDLLKELEKEKVLTLEMDQQRNMLIKML